MICNNCQTENLAGSKYCKKCGRPLTSNFITCKNGHNYDSNLAKCPYCPSTGEYDVFPNIKHKIPGASEEKTMLDNTAKTVVDNNKTVVDNNRTVIDKQDRTVIDPFSGSGSVYTNNPSSATVIITDDKNKDNITNNTNTNTNASSTIPKVVHNRKLVGWLVTFDLSEYGNDFKLYEGRNEIGAVQENDIVIQKEGISKRHCTILFRAGEFIIRDELSTNGTFINGKMIEQEKLKEGDTIKIGTVTLKFKTVF